MIYLTTGANGAGKTLLTLRDVREKSLKESRPVYYNGRFNLTADFGWQKLDIRDWQAIPDGAIFLVDECHNDFPVRSGKDPVPEYVRMLAEHRRRGFDFFLITQHPLNIDAFVRRLIGPPGWHRHLKRASGAPLVSVTSYTTVNEQCQKMGASDAGSMAMVPYPKEVYNWYESTSLDTAKVKVPFQVKVLIAAALLVPILAYFGWSTFTSRVPQAALAAQSSQVKPLPPKSGSAESGSLTPQEYVASFLPRVSGLPHTAPRYDEVTKPVVAPYPAACVAMADRCTCYTQQATKLPEVPDVLCRDIVKGGYFIDWQQAVADARVGVPVKADPAPVPVSQVPEPPQVVAMADPSPPSVEAPRPRVRPPQDFRALPLPGR